ncbi:MAG: hypothetical protein AAFW84_23710 [Cyanobacteria bacterium J06635_15]
MSDKPYSCSIAAPFIRREVEQFRLIQEKLESDISLNGDLNISDYVYDIPPAQETVQDISAWTEKRRETTRTKLVLWLVKILSCSLLVTFALTGMATFSPRADKELIRDLVPQLITTQVTLLGVAFGFYFSNKKG